MRFKQYLREDANLLDGYRENLDTMIHGGPILYRGFSTWSVRGGKITLPTLKVKMYKIKGRTEPRSSLTGRNLYIELASKWEGFPDRKLSAFTTQHVSGAGGFGDLSIVIPADNVKCFGYSTRDFNSVGEDDVKIKMAEILHDIAMVISSLHGILGMNNDDRLTVRLKQMAEDSDVLDMISSGDSFRSGKRIDEMSKFLDSLVAHFPSIVEDAKINGEADTLVDDLKTLKENLERAGWVNVTSMLKDITPEAMGVQIFNSFEDLPVKARANEIWFEGDYLIIQPFDPDELDISDKNTVIELLELLKEYK